MKLESSPGFLKHPGSDSGLAFGGGWGVGGDANTPNSITTRAVLLGIYSTFVSDHLIQSPIVLWTLRTRHWALRGLSAKTRNWLGGSLFFTRYLKYLGHVVVHCCPPFFSSVVASGVDVGGHDDAQAASRTPCTTSKTNPPTLRSGL